MSSAETSSPSAPAASGTAASSATTATARGSALRLADPGGAGHQAGEEERGAAERDERSRVVQVVRRMRDHELVADRDEHDPGDDREVQVGVDVAADLAPLLGRGRADPLEHRAGDLAEVQPPERRRGEEGEQERGDDVDAQPRVRGGGARQHDALTKRDDHEQLEALAETGFLDLPLAHRRGAGAGSQ